MSDAAQPRSDGASLLAITGLAALVLLLLGATLWWLPRVAPPLPHPEFESLFIRVGAQDHTPLRWWMGIATGVLSISLLGCLAVLGARRTGSTALGTSRTGAWMAAAFAAYAVPFVALMLAYRHEATLGGIEGWIWGMPPSTVWLLLGVWNAPWLIVLLLFVRFEQWTFTADDQRRFDELVTQYRSRDTSH